MLTGLHFLLTYRCIFECDHCFVYSGPNAASATFTPSQLRDILDDALQIGTIEWIYFEGGEAFLAYPVLMEGIRLARERGFQVGIVTNAYFATDEENAEFWLKPLRDLGIADLSISDDAFHYEGETPPARYALAAAHKLGLPTGSIVIDAPTVAIDSREGPEKGQPIVGGDVMFRGRAVERLAEGLPRRPYHVFTTCPYEDLVDPSRVHIDPFGHVHLCQGVSMGNLFKTPLSAMIRDYRAAAHPISGPLVAGGPARLAEAYDVPHEDGYVDACHLCYLIPRQLLDRFPEYLAPRQVYGLD